jgi:hypothetical protein
VWEKQFGHSVVQELCFLQGTKDVSWAQHVHRISHASYFPRMHVRHGFNKE